jgi:hypothetical protein
MNIQIETIGPPRLLTCPNCSFSAYQTHEETQGGFARTCPLCEKRDEYFVMRWDKFSLPHTYQAFKINLTI